MTARTVIDDGPRSLKPVTGDGDWYIWVATFGFKVVYYGWQN